MNETINVKLKCIGPVHIGNGNIIKKQDYFYDRVKKRVYIIDTLLLFNYLKSKNLLLNYENFIMAKSKEASLTDFVRQNGIRPEDFQKLSFYLQAQTKSPDHNYSSLSDPAFLLYHTLYRKEPALLSHVSENILLP